MEQTAIGQARQHIVLRLMRELFFHLFARSDVGVGAIHAQYPSARVSLDDITHAVYPFPFAGVRSDAVLDIVDSAVFQRVVQDCCNCCCVIRMHQFLEFVKCCHRNSGFAAQDRLPLLAQVHRVAECSSPQRQTGLSSASFSCCSRVASRCVSGYQEVEQRNTHDHKQRDDGQRIFQLAAYGAVGSLTLIFITMPNP
jgi:hypothetical protein